VKKGALKGGIIVASLFIIPSAVIVFAQESDLLRQIDEVLKQSDREIAQIRDELEHFSHLPIPEKPHASDLRQLDVAILELALEGVQREKKIFQEKRSWLLLKENGKISAEEMHERETALSQSVKPEIEQWRRKIKDAQERRSRIESESLKPTP